MKFQVLLSTMDQSKDKLPYLIHKCRIHADVLVINQCGRDTYYEFNIDQKLIQVYEADEKGLSKSRNRALKESDADVCLIADDDILYEEDIEHNIIKAFSQNPEYDIIAFYVERSSEFKQMSVGKQHSIGRIRSMNLMSVQIAFRKDSLINKNIWFDELFGAGSGVFICGEENIFLMDCIDKGCKILYVPKLIAKTDESESSWFHGYNELYFRSKGAVFQRLFPRLSLVFVCAFAFFKRNIYKDDMKWTKALHYMMLGRKEYMNLKKGEDLL